jgi:serine/threonine protein kinase
MSMEHSLDYLAGQVLSLVFYIITLMIYNRARKEYIGGKIAAAIKLVMGFLCIRLLADFTDYFAGILLPINADTVLILKIVLRLTAMCVLFFGGLRFFLGQSASRAPSRRSAPRPVARKKPADGPVLRAREPAAAQGSATVVLEDPVDEPADVPDDLPALGRYEILGQIGKGAMGVVYKGQDPKLQRLTAIKTIRFGDDFDEDQVDEIKKQFYREAKLVAKLSHPNIVAIYDIGEDLGLSYLAMEYLDGESLERYTRKENRLSVGQCLQVMIQVCDALAYAHSQDIVHRDIKPANIMLLKNGMVKVTDFGVARSTVGSQTRTGVVKGTPYYMSPEQAKGEKVTGVSDIFSLGVVFYQLLTGRLPFTGENLAAIMYQTMSVDPVPASKFNARVDKPILSILNRALEKDRQTRYQDAAKMAEQLRVLSRYRGEDSEKVSLRADRRPQQRHQNAKAAAPAAGPVAKRTQTVQGRPPGAVDTPASNSVNKGAADANGQSDTRKASGPAGASPGRRRLAIALAAGILLSTPFLYLWHKNRSMALHKSDLAAYRVKKDVKPQKPARLKVPAKEPEPAGDATSKQVAEAAIKTTPQAEQALPAADIAVKEREAEQIAREAAEKKQEQARLAREAAEKKQEQARLAREAAEKKQLEEKRRAIAEEQRRMEQARLAETVRKQKLQSAEIKTIEQMVAAAKAKLAGREYTAAAEAYEKALAMLSDSEFKSSEQYQALRQTVAAALQDEDLIYGAKGYIYYKNKWFSPENYQKQLLSEGFVHYKGALVPHKKIEPVIEDLAVREVRAFLRKMYAGRQVHKKQIELHDLRLLQNTWLQSSYAVLFDWEIWTFNDIANGMCSVEVLYDAEKDEWKTKPVRKQ